MAVPAYDSAGTAYDSATIAGTHSVNVPAHSAGDLLLLVAGWFCGDSNGALSSINTGGWTKSSDYPFFGNGMAFGWKIGNGSETSVSVTAAGTGATDDISMRVLRFTCATGFDATPIQAVGSLGTGENQAAVAMPSVDPPGTTDALAVAVMNNNNGPGVTYSEATGESGGNWTEPVTFTGVGGAKPGVQISAQAGGAAISGGTAVMSVSSYYEVVGFAIVAGPAVTITDVGTDEIIDDLQQNVTITGTGFGASQGAGKVEVGDDTTYAGATKVELAVDSWADTSIQVDFANITGGTAISLVLRTRPLYVFVTPDGGSPSAAFAITLNDSDAYLASLDTGLSFMSGLAAGTKPAGILAHWHFDDPSGAVLEDRWRTHDGTYQNTPTLAQTALPPNSGRGSVLFDTSQNEYAEKTHAAAFAAGEIAIHCWFKVNALVDGTVIWSKNGSTPAAGDVRLKVDANGQVTFSVWNATPTELTIQSPTGYVAADQTVHASVVCDDAGFRLYLDGNEVGTAITSYTAGLTANTTRAWRFGAAGA